MTEEFLLLHNFVQFYASAPKKLANFSKNYGYFAQNSERRKNLLQNFLSSAIVSPVKRSKT
jgi:hypothetical protein